MDTSSKKLLVVLAVTALVVLVPANGGVAYAATLCVNTAGTHGCYTSIQAAVNAAQPGDTIAVYPGTYAGGVVVDKAGVKINALRQRGRVKVAGTGSSGPVFGLTIIANNVQIQGFEIYGFSDQHDASGIFVGGTFAGDTSHPADGAVIRFNTLHDNGNGVYLWQSNSNHVRYNIVYHSKDFDGVEGVGILSFNGFGDAQVIAANAAGRSGKNNDISNNLVYDNDRLAIFAGACTEPAFGCVGPTGLHDNITGTTIAFNVAYGNGAHSTEAIGFLDAHGGTIADNLVHLNQYHGILINFSDGAVVKRNKANHNSRAVSGYSGIRVNNSNGVAVSANMTNRNSYGLRVTGSMGDTFANNSAFNNALYDLYWDGTGTETFATNRCRTAYPSKATWNCR